VSLTGSEQGARRVKGEALLVITCNNFL